MTKHLEFALLGCLLSLWIAPSCSDDSDPIPTATENAQVEPASGDEIDYPMDWHRNRNVKEWIDDIEGDDRFKCYKAIVAVGEMEEKGVLAVPAITRCLHDENSDGGIKRKAIGALGRIGGKEALASLDGCMQGTDAVLGVLAADAMGAMGSWAVDMIIPYLSSPKAVVRERGARALRGVLATDGTVTQMEAAVVPLARALSDSNARVREEAFGVLSELGPSAISAAPILIEKLKIEENREQRKLLMVMIGMYGTASVEAVPYLRESLNEDDKQIQIFAALALARVGEVDEGLEPLMALLSDPDTQIRLTAVDALRRLGPLAIAAVEPLKQAKKNANDALHLMIEQALKAVRKQP